MIPVNGSGPRTWTHHRISSANTKVIVKEPKNVIEMAEKIESDYQFLLGKLVICSLIQATKVTIETQSDDPAARALAANLQEVWDKTLPDMLRCFGVGRAAFEKRFGPYDQSLGIRRLESLEFLEPQYTEMLISESDGSFLGIKYDTGKGDKITIDADESWWLALNPTARQPYGRSQYIGAPYQVWLAREKLRTQHDRWTTRHANGHGVGRAPSKYPSTTNASKGSAGEITAEGNLENPLEDIRAGIEDLGSGGTLVLPSERDGTGNPLFDYLPPTPGGDSTALETRWQKLDAAALRSIGVPERAVTQDQETGSLAMAAVHWKVLGTRCEELLSQLKNSFRRYVILKAVEANFDDAKPIITIVSQPVHDEIKSIIVELVKQIIVNPAVSPLLLHGVVDLEKLLDIAGIPMGSDVRAKLAAIIDEAKPAPALPSLMSRMALSTVRPREVRTWDEYAARATAEADRLYAEMLSAIGEGPGELDRGRL